MQYRVLTPVKAGETISQPGEFIDLPDNEAQELIAAGAIGPANKPFAQDTMSIHINFGKGG